MRAIHWDPTSAAYIVAFLAVIGALYAGNLLRRLLQSRYAERKTALKRQDRHARKAARRGGVRLVIQ